MSEKLTEQERQALNGVADRLDDGSWLWFGKKALRILDAQTEALAMAERRYLQAREALNEGITGAARDHELATEWKALAEARQIDLRVLETSHTKALERADFFQGEHRKALDETLRVLDECERLRTRVRELFEVHVHAQRAETAEARLATVEAELARSQAEHRGWADRAYAVAAERNAALDRLEVAEGLLRAYHEGNYDHATVASIEAFLASAQPAAPYGTPDEYPGFNAAWPIGKPKPAAPHPPRGVQGRPELTEIYPDDQPAAPARTEAENNGFQTTELLQCSKCAGFWPAHSMHTIRTEAEQAVLDAMANADMNEYRAPDGARVLTYTNSHIEAACRAELALRGLK